MKATADVLTTTKFGMFCILGISKLEQIDLAAEHGLGFIRIGTNVENVADAEPFIAKAGSYGMFISANFMNMYVMEPIKFAEKVKKAEVFGAELLCLEDSACSMFLGDLDRYFGALQGVWYTPPLAKMISSTRHVNVN